MYHSAVARYFAPSDLCGAGGMYQERIRSNPDWRNEHSRRDTVFIETGQGGMQGMAVGRVQLFFSFASDREQYPCALVEWFIPGDEPDEDTGMWVVRPEFYGNGRQTLAIIHLDCIARAAHLLPVFGSSFVPDELHFSDSLDVYQAYLTIIVTNFYHNSYLSYYLFYFILILFVGFPVLYDLYSLAHLQIS